MKNKKKDKWKMKTAREEERRKRESQGGEEGRQEERKEARRKGSTCTSGRVYDRRNNGKVERYKERNRSGMEKENVEGEKREKEE